MSRARLSPASAVNASDRAHALAITPVSRETAARLERFIGLLLSWQRATHLIAPSTVPNLWTRHIADSLQLLDLVPQARVWVDFGSGGGFPGMVIACALAEAPGAIVHLVESNTKKAAFLREAQRLTQAPVHVHAARMGDLAQRFQGQGDVLTARAVAPLNSLLDQCFLLLGKNGATGLFPKGQNAELELAQARRAWTMDAALMPSRTHPSGRIIVVRDVERSKLVS
ncbi:MAG TPA: 16S rRNA (guanine(527)-N(7))-methyltransferase RsmG [Xanthobacteraceae bacterium]